MGCAFDIMYKKFSLALSPPNFLLCFLKKFYSLWFIPNIIDFDPFWVHFYVSVKFGLRLASLPVVSDCSSTVCWKHSFPHRRVCAPLAHVRGAYFCPISGLHPVPLICVCFHQIPRPWSLSLESKPQIKSDSSPSGLPFKKQACLFLQKSCLDFYRNCIKPINQLWEKWHLYGVESSSSCAWLSLPLISFIRVILSSAYKASVCFVIFTSHYL